MGTDWGVTTLLHNRLLRISASTEMWRRFFSRLFGFLSSSSPCAFWLVLEPFWRPSSPSGERGHFSPSHGCSGFAHKGDLWLALSTFPDGLPIPCVIVLRAYPFPCSQKPFQSCSDSSVVRRGPVFEKSGQS